MKKLFETMDDTGDGCLNLEEFQLLGGRDPFLVELGDASRPCFEHVPRLLGGDRPSSVINVCSHCDPESISAVGCLRSIISTLEFWSQCWRNREEVGTVAQAEVLDEPVGDRDDVGQWGGIVFYPQIV